jgi:hypothetical protein
VEQYIFIINVERIDVTFCSYCHSEGTRVLSYLLFHSVKHFLLIQIVSEKENLRMSTMSDLKGDILYTEI